MNNNLVQDPQEQEEPLGNADKSEQQDCGGLMEQLQEERERHRQTQMKVDQLESQKAILAEQLAHMETKLELKDAQVELSKNASKLSDSLREQVDHLLHQFKLKNNQLLEKDKKIVELEWDLKKEIIMRTVLNQAGTEHEKLQEMLNKQYEVSGKHSIQLANKINELEDQLKGKEKEVKEIKNLLQCQEEFVFPDDLEADQMEVSSKGPYRRHTTLSRMPKKITCHRIH